jgi:hypothetical protein
VSQRDVVSPAIFDYGIAGEESKPLFRNIAKLTASRSISFSKREAMMRTSGKWSMALGIVLALAGAAVQAKDFNKLLQGDYIVTGGSAACLNSNLGFTPAPDLQPVFGPGGGTSVNSFNISAVRTFNGDGTGTAVGRTVAIGHPAGFGGGGIGSSDIVSEFTYEVGPDLIVTIHTVSLTSTQRVGPRRGEVSTIENFPPFVGRISEDLGAMTLAHVDPQVETVHTAGRPDQQRICYRDRVLIRAKRH